MQKDMLNWPPVGTLPKSWWKLWQTFLEGWCGTSLRLPIPLGSWYEDAEMLTQCCFFLHAGNLIMQHKDEFFAFSPYSTRARTRFQLEAHPFTDLQRLHSAQVVDIAYKSNSIFVISKSEQNIIAKTSTLMATSLQDLYNELPPEIQWLVGRVEWPQPHELIAIATSICDGRAMGVSDGSVRTLENRASQAWIIQAMRGDEIRGFGTVDGNETSRTSHRAELQGQAAIVVMLSLLVKFFNIFGAKIATYCDNQTVVKKMQQGWRLWRYRNTKGPDGDLQALLRNSYKISDWITRPPSLLNG